MIFQDHWRPWTRAYDGGTDHWRAAAPHCPELSADGHRARVLAMMQRVGLTAQQINPLSHEFSGIMPAHRHCPCVDFAAQRWSFVDEAGVGIGCIHPGANHHLPGRTTGAEMGLALIFIA